MKYCKQCKTNKEHSEFYKSNQTSDGLQYSCKLCQHSNNRTTTSKERRKIYQKQYKKNITEFMRGLKDGPCMDCGIQYPVYVMEFDHRDASKKSFTIGSSGRLGKSRETILKEVAKCDLVCSNCHREREWQRKVLKMNSVINNHE